jgi:hypothetical protein
MWAGVADLIGAIVGGIVDLIRAVAWPVVVLVGFLLFRRELPKLAQRVRSVSISQVSVEFTVQEFRPPPGMSSVVEVLQDLPGRNFKNDSILDLVKELQEERAAEYVVIDLSSKWFTSRLFLYADLLDRVRRLPCMVFVETSDNISRRFIGIATPKDVCQALVEKEDWLADDYKAAYMEVNVGPTFDPEMAKLVAVKFRAELQEGRDDINEDDPEELAEWSVVAGRDEHTTQVTVKALRQMLGPRLRTTDYILDSPDLSEEERRRRVVLRGHGDGAWVPFIAALDEERSFVRLLNRARLLEAVACTVAREKNA